jgi:hypothetical protein
MPFPPKFPVASNLRRTACGVAVTAFISATGCVSDDPMNTTGGSARLSQAANNSSQYTGSWDLQTTNMDERWSEDPTVMEPDYPYAGLQPGFGSSAFTQYGS